MSKENLLLSRKKFVPHFGDEFSVSENFTDLLEQNAKSQVKEGDVVKGMVISVNADVIVVDVGLKNEGRIAISEFTLSSKDALPEAGDLIDVYVEKLEVQMKKEAATELAANLAAKEARATAAAAAADESAKEAKRLADEEAKKAAEAAKVPQHEQPK